MGSLLEHEAKRVLLEAQSEAARQRDEWLESDRRDRAPLAFNKRQIEESLDAAATAVTRIRELIAALPSVESHQSFEKWDGSAVPAVSPAPKEDVASRRNRVMNFIAGRRRTRRDSPHYPRELPIVRGVLKSQEILPPERRPQRPSE
jgi:hypothetical protein